MGNGTQRRATLTGKKSQGLDLAFLGLSRGEMSRILGVNRSTVHRWFQDPEFQAELERLRGDRREHAKASLDAMVPEALAALKRDLTDPAAPRALCQKAALAVLDRAGFGTKSGVELSSPDSSVLSIEVLSHQERAALLERLTGGIGPTNGDLRWCSPPGR